MKSALSNRIGGETAFLEWSSLDRDWLFHCLTDSPGHENLPHELQDGGTVAQLKANLCKRSDVPDGAFGSKSLDTSNAERLEGSELSPNREAMIDKQSVDHEGDDRRLNSQYFAKDSYGPGKDSSEEEKAEKQKGSLDFFFEEEEEFSGLELREGSASHEERAALTVQESVAIMLKATAFRRLTKLKNEWKAANEEQQKREFLKNRDTNDEHLNQGIASKGGIYESLNDEELSQTCRALGKQAVEAMTTARELTESAKQLNSRLLDYCAADGVEGRLNTKKQQELAKALDQHLAQLPDDPRPTESGANEDYVFGMDEFDSSIDPMFGGDRPKKTIPPPKMSNVQQTNGGKFKVYDSIFE